MWKIGKGTVEANAIEFDVCAMRKEAKKRGHVLNWTWSLDESADNDASNNSNMETTKRKKRKKKTWKIAIESTEGRQLSQVHLMFITNIRNENEMTET